MNLYKFVVHKRSNEWPDSPFWTNRYIVDMDEVDVDVLAFGRTLAAMEKSIHQEHVYFMHTVAYPCADGDGLPIDENDMGTTKEDIRTRVIQMQEANFYGSRANEFDGMEAVCLRVSLDFPGARSGYHWYRGVLGESDLIRGEKNYVGLRDVAYWRMAINDYYAYWYGFDPHKFYTARTGKNREKFGYFTPTTKIVARGATVAGAITRAKKRLPNFRITNFDAITQGLYSLALNYEIWKTNYDFSDPFNSEDAKVYAIEIMQSCVYVAESAKTTLQLSQSKEPSNEGGYSTRFGPTCESLIMQASTVVKGDAGSYAPSDTFAANMSELEEIFPEIHIAGSDFYSHAQMEQMKDIFLTYVYACWNLARGDYLPTLARQWPPANTIFL